MREPPWIEITAKFRVRYGRLIITRYFASVELTTPLELRAPMTAHQAHLSVETAKKQLRQIQMIMERRN